MKDTQKAHILWALFWGTIGVVAIEVVLRFFVEVPYLFTLLKVTFPILLCLLHALWTLGSKRGFVFLLLSFVVGFCFEWWGVHHGIIVDGEYTYDASNYALLLDGVPLLVPFYWTVFIYLGYSLVNSFLFWLGATKPSQKEGNWILLPILILLDGFLTAAIDLVMDPVAVASGSWMWFDEGSYFGIPIINFFGWVIVTVTITTLFRGGEYFLPQKKYMKSESLQLLPLVGYAAVFVTYVLMAIEMELYGMLLIGAFFLLPIVLISLLLFLLKKEER